MEYFHTSLPRYGYGFCSDWQCPCNETPIPVGEGYLYISLDCCIFRWDCRTTDEAYTKAERYLKESSATMMGPGHAVPILVCELGARKRRLDLAIAARDAKHWWATEQVPFRPTPQAGEPEVPFTGQAAISQPSAPPVLPVTTHWVRDQMSRAEQVFGEKRDSTALKYLLEVLSVYASEKSTLRMAGRVLKMNMKTSHRAASKEPITPTQMDDPRLSSLFCSCDVPGCGGFWISAKVLDPDQDHTISNPIGGQCKKCRRYFCRAHFGAEGACPQCGLVLDHAPPPNGRSSSQTIRLNKPLVHMLVLNEGAALPGSALQEFLQSVVPDAFEDSSTVQCIPTGSEWPEAPVDQAWALLAKHHRKYLSEEYSVCPIELRKNDGTRMVLLKVFADQPKIVDPTAPVPQTKIVDISPGSAEAALGAEHPDTSAQLNDLAILCQSQGRYSEAEPLFIQALAIVEAARGADHPETGAQLNNLAGLYLNQSRYGEAEPLYRRSLAIAEVARGAEHPDTGIRLNNLAGLYASQGRYSEAEPLYRRSLAITEAALGTEHPDTGHRLHNLASVYEHLGRSGEAEPLYRRALAIAEAALGAEHPETGARLNNLGCLYSNQGRHDEAEPLLIRALAVTEASLGAGHPTTGARLINLAGFFENQGRNAEAEPLYRRALAITEATLGAEHPDTAARLDKLARVYVSLGRYGEAEPLFIRALAIAEAALGAEHSITGFHLNNLASFYEKQDRYGEAEPLFIRALAITEATLGAQDPETGARLYNLACVYESQERYDEAEPLYRRSLAIAEAALGAEHPKTSARLHNLAGLYRRQGRYGEAEPLYRRALAIAETALGAEHPTTAGYLNNLAILYQSQGRYGEAKAVYERALAIVGKRFGPDHPQTKALLGNYEALRQSMAAARHAQPTPDQPTAKRGLLGRLFRS